MTITTHQLKEGFGLPILHVGQHAKDVVARFGQPARKRKASAVRVYWVYPHAGFDCLISAKSKRLLSVFFYAKGCEGHREAKVATTSGLSFGETEERVLKAYGVPYKKGGGFVTGSGDYVRKWLAYRGGIGFHIGRGNDIQIISIFRAPRKSSARSK